MGSYLCIDLKCFYASVECCLRGLDPMTSALVVADGSRGQGAIVLAISPYLKGLGIKNRCRLFEIPPHISYICAKPQMKKYIEYSTMVYKCYLKYCDSKDIHVYSIDEAFLELSSYMQYYNKPLEEIGLLILNEIYQTTLCTAVCGAGDNMLLAKLAMDVLAKKSQNHVAYLNQELFIEKLWHHQPLEDVWQIGANIARNLRDINIFNLHDIAMSNKEDLKRQFGIIGLELYYHAWGIDDTCMKDIRKYIPQSRSLSHSQTLGENYNYIDAFVVLEEMIDLLAMDLVRQGLYCKTIGLYVGYSKEIKGGFKVNYTMDNYTSSFNELKKAFKNIYLNNIVDLPIRRLGVNASRLTNNRNDLINLFNFDGSTKEEALYKAINGIKDKYGKNAVNKAISYTKAGTMVQRNKLIGGHNSE